MSCLRIIIANLKFAWVGQDNIFTYSVFFGGGGGGRGNVFNPGYLFYHHCTIRLAKRVGLRTAVRETIVVHKLGLR